MSLLGKALVDFATAQPGFSGVFPGKIHPDTEPQGLTAADLPYGFTESISRVPHFGLSFVPVAYTERLRVRIVGDQRKSATIARDWLIALIGSNPVNLTVNGFTLKNWHVEDDGTDGNEDRVDGTDRNLRFVDLNLVGNY